MCKLQHFFHSLSLARSLALAVALSIAFFFWLIISGDVVLPSNSVGFWRGRGRMTDSCHTASFIACAHFSLSLSYTNTLPSWPTPALCVWNSRLTKLMLIRHMSDPHTQAVPVCSCPDSQSEPFAPLKVWVSHSSILAAVNKMSALSILHKQEKKNDKPIINQSRQNRCVHLPALPHDGSFSCKFKWGEKKILRD